MPQNISVVDILFNTYANKTRNFTGFIGIFWIVSKQKNFDFWIFLVCVLQFCNVINILNDYVNEVVVRFFIIHMWDVVIPFTFYLNITTTILIKLICKL